MKNLFIALKTKYYEAFCDGTKSTEFRKYGKRWNEDVCKLGRKVTLSKGYGKQHRKTGVIVGFEKRMIDSTEWIDCYGEPGLAACITIELLLSANEVELLENLVQDAEIPDEKMGYWINGADMGQDYCYECACKEVEKINDNEVHVDGGWDCEHESPPHCEVCTEPLGHTLTDCGLAEEIEHHHYYKSESSFDSLRSFFKRYWPELSFYLIRADTDSIKLKQLNSLARAVIKHEETKPKTN